MSEVTIVMSRNWLKNIISDKIHNKLIDYEQLALELAKKYTEVITNDPDFWPKLEKIQKNISAHLSQCSIEYTKYVHDYLNQKSISQKLKKLNPNSQDYEAAKAQLDADNTEASRALEESTTAYLKILQAKGYITTQGKDAYNFVNSMAAAFFEDYIQALQVFQKIGFYDPQAVIAIYTKENYRYEIQVAEANKYLTAAWKTFGKSIQVTCTSEYEKIIQLIRQDAYESEKTNDIFGRKVSLYKDAMDTIHYDYGVFKTMCTQMFIDKNQKTPFQYQSRSINQGHITEAFEIHYQNIYNELYDENNKHNSIFTLQNSIKESIQKEIFSDSGLCDIIHHYTQNATDPSYFAQYNALWKFLMQATGTLQGIAGMDQGVAQVKLYNASFINSLQVFQKLQNMLNTFTKEGCEASKLAQALIPILKEYQDQIRDGITEVAMLKFENENQELIKEKFMNHIAQSVNLNTILQ